MAAPIPLYIPSTNPACLLCKKSPSKRLHCLTKFKSTKENYVRAIEDFTRLVLEKALLDKMYVCETCASKCQMSVNFKEACVDNIRDFEKLHKRQNSTFFLEAVSFLTNSKFCGENEAVKFEWWWCKKITTKIIC